MSPDTRRSRIRVVHVSSVHQAGDPRIFEKQCTSLRRAGYDVRLVATGQVPAHAELPVIAYRRSDHRVVRMTAGVARAVVRAVAMRPKVVHLHDPELIPAVPFLRLLGIKVVFDSHEHIVASMPSKAYLRAGVRKVVQRFSALLVAMVDRTASAVVVATPAIATEFHNPRTVVVQNFPVLDQWLDIGDRIRATNQLVYVGGITEGRGAFGMLDAIERLGESHGARLALAGPVAPELLSRMQQHPGWRHADYVGVLDRAQVADLLARSTIGVVLLLPEPNYLRSQPTKMFEYMAAGLPVLASDYPLWRELVLPAGTGAVADPLDVGSVVREAAHLLEHPEERAAMGRRGRELVETTRNWRVEAEHLVELYDELTGVTTG
jgi:glycosyltransferase involved in cell wall biosynthesis